MATVDPKPIGGGFLMLPPQRKEDRPQLAIAKRFAHRRRPVVWTKAQRETWAERKRNEFVSWS